MHERQKRRVLDLLRRFDHAMLVTKNADGLLHARPMALAGAAEAGCIRFLTAAGSHKLDEIARDPQVAVVFRNRNLYLSVSGHARLNDDPDMLRRLWSDRWREWFPGGSADPALCLLEIEPLEAAYWDRGGLNRLRYWLASRFAIMRGSRPSVPAGTEARVDFRRC